ncbi:MAG TPA: BlaI/MecI/CopY family transcriptional regulator [Verrucomicrobiales bacterium]|jgi:predicted transcriptional regulator|nr:BlaI/MecI/CopY family transcriptional regulator [Verrucomicrobiales bacterium]
MAAKRSPSLPHPTDSELSILRILWDRGQGTVREVLEVLNAERGEEAGYTTVLKLMQIMHEKGLLLRDDTERTHIYRAAAPPDRTQRQVVGDLMDRVFGGSALALVQQALGAKKVSPEELKQIRELIQSLERR